MGIEHIIEVERDHFGDSRRDAKILDAGQRESEKPEVEQLSGNKQRAKPRPKASSLNPAMSETKEDLSKLNFEDALKRLEDIVRKLENGDVPLDQSIALYSEG
jgi:DNA-nicking Smr family endonuclease